MTTNTEHHHLHPEGHHGHGRDHGHEHPKELTIIVNGRPKHPHSDVLTYIEVVRLAFENAVVNDRTVYTVTFEGGPHHKPEGTLVEGEDIRLKDHMCFHVTATNKS